MTQTMHYAACYDCPLYKWADEYQEALEMAEAHGDNFGHSAYVDTAPVKA